MSKNPINRDKDAPISIGGQVIIEEGVEATNANGEAINPTKFIDPTAEETGFVPEKKSEKPEENDDLSYSIGDKKFTSKEDFLKEAEKYKGLGEDKKTPKFEISGDDETQKQIDELLKASESNVAEIDDENKLGMINKMFDSNFESLDQATQNYSTLKSDNDSLKQKNITLENQVKTTQNPFQGFKGADDLAKAYYFMKETGMSLKEYDRVSGFNADNINPLNLLMEDYLSNNPKENPQLVRKMFEREYKLTPAHFRNDSRYSALDDTEFNEASVQDEIKGEIALNELKLKKDVSPIVNKYKELQEKAKLPDFKKMNEESEAESKVAEATRLSTWDESIKGKIQNFKKYVDQEEGQDNPYVEMDVSDSQRVEVEKITKQYIRDNKLDPSDDKHKKFIDNFIRNVFETKYKQVIRKHYAKTLEKAVDDKWRERNGEIIKKKNVTDKEHGVKDSDKENQDAEDAAMNAVTAGNR